MTVITRTSYLEVNAVPLSTPAWWITNLDPEILASQNLKGGDINIPHAGSLANPRRTTVTVKLFQMVIVGNVDKDGATIGNYRTGVTTNVEYLRANLGIVSATGDGTVTATWHRWDASTKTAAVTVLGLHTSDLGKRQVSAVLELSLPLGVFA